MIGTEVIVEGGFLLDVFEGLDFSFNYSVSDIRNPDERQTEFSKTVKCPGTSKNNTLFGNIFEADIANPFDPNIDNIGVNFNPNKKADVQVLENTFPVLTGFMQLRKITITKGRIEYEVVFIGRLVDLFGAWGDKKMNSIDENGNHIIDLSDYDHLLTDTAQVTSWSSTLGDGYVYPLIDYGKTFDIDISGRRIYPAADLRLAVYVRTLWDRMFSFAGAIYDGDILNVTQADGFDFDRLIVPFIDGFRLSDSDIAERRAVGLTPPVLYVNAVPFLLGSGYGGFIHCSDIVTENTNGQITQASGSPTILQSFTPDNNGRYKISGEAVLRSVRTTATGNTGGTPVKFRLYVNSVQIEEVESVALPNMGILQIGTPYDYSLPFSFAEIDTNAGDVVLVQYLLTSDDWDHLNDNTDTRFMEGTTIIFEGVNESLYYGDPVSVNIGLPDITIKDFFLSIVKMFNLYMLPDKSVDNLYHFYTRDQFYSSGQVRDWTYKMDRGRPIDITPMGLLSGREYIYSYTEDGDYYNERYQGNYSRPYGTRRIDIDNDFVPEEKVNEISFSPTPLANDLASSRIIPKIYDADISDGAKPTEVNTRILYYGGLLPSLPNWIHLTTTGSSVRTTYPYAGHWNHPITPTLDINFGLSLEYYYQSNGATGTIQFTNNNLFKAYHERQFLEIASKDSKLVTAMFDLTALDIHQLDFRDTILIDQTYYRINKVMNYNPFKAGLTKVELFKAGDILYAKSETSPAWAGIPMGSGKMEEKAPSPVSKTLINNNQYEPFQGKVIGKGNIISPSAVGFLIQGDDNTIGASKNVTLIGSNCTVANGVENVTAIGVDGITITESDTVVNGSGSVQKKTVTIPSADVHTLGSTPIDMGITVSENQYIIPISCAFNATYNSAAYATNTTLNIGAAGASEYMFTLDVLGFTSDTFTQMPMVDGASNETQYILGAGAEVVVSGGGDPTSGDSDISVSMVYIIATQ